MRHSTALPTAIGILRHKHSNWRHGNFHVSRHGLADMPLSDFVTQKHA